MKEKISCSLDGKIIERIDDLINLYPIISTRSALIEMACIMFMDSYDYYDTFDLDKQITFDEESHQRDDFIRRMYEMRCDWNAKTESTN